MKIGEGRRATTARATRRAIGSEEQQTEQALAIMIGRGREASTRALLDLLRRSRFAGLLARLDLATWGPQNFWGPGRSANLACPIDEPDSIAH